MAFVELKVDDWVEELDVGLEYRRRFGLEEHWPKLESLFYDIDPSAGREGPNIIFSTGDSFLASLTVPKPVVMVKPRRAGKDQTAQVLESVDNELIVDCRTQKAMETACLHAFLFGRGFIKVGYDSEWGWDLDLDIGKSNLVGLTTSQFDSKGRRIEFRSGVRPGMPWVQSVLPHDIVVPAGVIEMEDSPWVAHRVIRHIDDLRADPKYSGTRDLEPQISMEDYIRSYQSLGKNRQSWGDQNPSDSSGRGWRCDGTGKAEYVELYEIHEKRTGRVKVITPGSKKFLRNEPDLLQLNGLPFVGISFLPRARAFWCTPPAFYLKQEQAELSDIAIQASKQRRLSVLKFLYADDAFDDDELEKLFSARVGAAAKVNTSRVGGDLSKAVQTFQPFSGNNQLVQDREEVRRNAREMIGLSRNQAGEYEATGRRTASEAHLVQQSSDLRMGRHQTTVMRAHQELVEKLNGIIFHFWTTPRWAQVLGPDGMAQWVEYNGTGLKGDWSYDISLSNEPIETLQGRKQQALQMYQTLAADPTVDPLALRRYLVGAFNDPSFGKIFKPEIQSPQGSPRSPRS